MTSAPKPKADVSDEALEELARRDADVCEAKRDEYIETQSTSAAFGARECRDAILALTPEAKSDGDE